MALLNTMQRTRLLAGTIAMMGCTLSFGGSLLLAEHYAQNGASGEGSGYHAALQVGRCECLEVPAARTTAASTLCGVANS